MAAFTMSGRGNPCPVCDRTKDADCRWTSKDFVLCHTHRPGDYVPGWVCCGEAKNPLWTCWRRGGTGADGLAFARRPTEQQQRKADNRAVHGKDIPTPQTRNWGQWIAENRASPEEVRMLAEILGVRVIGLDRLRVGFFPEDDEGPRRFCFPARNGKDQAIGAQWRYTAPLPAGHRHAGKTKINVQGGFSGLYYDPLDWYHPSRGPLLLVEGASDTAALLGLNLNVVGRPSNLGGVDALVERLRDLPPGTEIIVVGENDRHTSAKGEDIWPGKDGAVRTAQVIATKLPQLVVYWGLAPDGAKDSREWVADRDTDRTCDIGVATGYNEELGRFFLRRLCLDITVCIGADPMAAFPVPSKEAGQGELSHRMSSFLGINSPQVPAGSQPDLSRISAGSQPDAIKGELIHSMNPLLGINSPQPVVTAPINDEPPNPDRVGVGSWIRPGAASCPARSSCPNRTTEVLAHTSEAGKHRLANFSCDCWHCTCCRQIKASATINHIADMAQDALDDGDILYTMELAADERDSVRKQLRKHASEQDETFEYAELQRADAPDMTTTYLFVIAVSATLVLPDAIKSKADKVTDRRLGELLSDWAISIRRSGYERKAGKQRIRPVNYSVGWRLLKNAPTGNWKLLGGCPAQKRATVETLLRGVGVVPTRYGGEGVGAFCLPFVWHLDFHLPETIRERVLDALKVVTDPPPSGQCPFT